jgi:hypothetical protein
MNFQVSFLLLRKTDPIFAGTDILRNRKGSTEAQNNKVMLDQTYTDVAAKLAKRFGNPTFFIDYCKEKNDYIFCDTTGAANFKTVKKKIAEPDYLSLDHPVIKAIRRTIIDNAGEKEMLNEYVFAFLIRQPNEADNMFFITLKSEELNFFLYKIKDNSDNWLAIEYAIIHLIQNSY